MTNLQKLFFPSSFALFAVLPLDLALSVEDYELGDHRWRLWVGNVRVLVTKFAVFLLIPEVINAFCGI